ncbi:TonB-dependent receptor [Rubripirellula reticaptiva]|uniref:Uncharacterized protein n=1 Tax=Rubripirellula reticaptiva TaxID=2528013 RepID=A0A5C6EJS2_9BACT|nr:TonB-dependent receptor [Rubripirellula reticaptiva]TWU47866.1 hypothetical protein Poly59_47080 [Rubripirellula reticaptiva]
MRLSQFCLASSLAAVCAVAGWDTPVSNAQTISGSDLLRSNTSQDPLFGQHAFRDRVVHDPALGDRSISDLILSGPVIDPTMDGIYPPTVYMPADSVASMMVSQAAGEVPIERFRKSFYQGTEVLGGHLWDTGNDDVSGRMNQTFEEARINFGFPIGVITGGSMDNIVGFRPYFRVDHLDGPTGIDVPGSVYDTGISILNQKKWSEVFSTTVVVTPSVRSDFDTSDNGFRLFGLALMNWKPRPNLTLSAGVVYFARNDIGLLPAVGFVYLPTPWWKIDATMPRPRLARRLWKNGGHAEGWAFVGASIGGNTWAVKRSSGESDELTVRAYELIGGYEVIGAGNRGFNIETVYTFGRRIEYERDDVRIDLSDGVGIRAAWQF